MDAWIWILIVVAVVVVLALIWLSKQRSRRLDEQREEARELRQQAESRSEEADERRAAADQMAQRAEADRVLREATEERCAGGLGGLVGEDGGKLDHDRRTFGLIAP